MVIASNVTFVNLLERIPSVFAQKANTGDEKWQQYNAMRMTMKNRQNREITAKVYFWTFVRRVHCLTSNKSPSIYTTDYSEKRRLLYARNKINTRKVWTVWTVQPSSTIIVNLSTWVYESECNTNMRRPKKGFHYPGTENNWLMNRLNKIWTNDYYCVAGVLAGGGVAIVLQRVQPATRRNYHHHIGLLVPLLVWLGLGNVLTNLSK